MANVEAMVPFFQIVNGPDPDLAVTAERARRYITSFPWVASLKALYFDRGFEKVAVFFAEINPLEEAVPELWLVVGDLPPAVIDGADAPNGALALALYVAGMREWTATVCAGHPTDHLPLVVHPDTLEPVEENAATAETVECRLAFIESHLLPQWIDDLEPTA